MSQCPRVSETKPQRNTIHPLFNGKYDCYWNVQNKEVIIFPFSKAWKFCHVLCTYWLHNWVLLEWREPESQEICLHLAWIAACVNLSVLIWWESTTRPRLSEAMWKQRSCVLHELFHSTKGSMTAKGKLEAVQAGIFLNREKNLWTTDQEWAFPLQMLTSCVQIFHQH